MSTVLTLPEHRRPQDLNSFDTQGWKAWLAEHIEPDWRPGEWDTRHWLFTADLDNPRTSSSACRTRRCDQVVISGNIFCGLCAETLRATGQDPQEFAEVLPSGPRQEEPARPGDRPLFPHP